MIAVWRYRVENIEIAAVLQNVADLLEIKGANPFRIRAYRNAAQVVAEWAAPLRKLVEEECDLTELPSIGKDMARHIEELVSRGELMLLQELSQDVPLSLVELTRLPGLGAKKARKLWDELGVETLDDLESAAERGAIATLPGFGEKTQDKILTAIDRYRKRRGRMKLGDADQHAVPLLDYLRANPEVKRVEVAGSYRRRRETVRDLDVLVIATQAEAVMGYFTSYPDIKQVESSGETRSTVVLRSGLQVDLRIVAPQSYGAALSYFTGSKEHNVKLRMRAIQRGLRLSEYGVFRGGEEEAGDPWAGEFVAGRDENEVYESLGLAWIPPELRENRGEIEAAERSELPDLITVGAIRGDLQMHSTWSDGKNTLEEMLEACVARGYEYFAITDHSKALAMTGGLDGAKLREQWTEIDEIAERHPGIEIMRGMEVDILGDGALDLEDAMLAQLDIVLISVHSRFDLPPGDQTERIIKALGHPAVNVLAHPTGRQINRRDPMQFDLDAVLQSAADSGVAVELNAHPDRLDLNDVQLMRARELGCDIVISTDAHRTTDLDLMRYGVEQARRAWLQPADVLNTLPFTELVRRLQR
ncbi:MAG: DNA polymerase/3'-5' exonuclease PolX [Gemmatimonadota bacterium]|nr:MAG: DNA polymerase/3'-5' exonuclease PolX [Gemmatimonadota bacterium]